jgi:hypothetical protein
LNDKLELLLLSLETAIGEGPQIAKAVRQAVDE